MEERAGVGEERSRFSKYLRVGRPSQSLIALRTVGGYRQVVGALSPEGVRDELINELVARGDDARLEVLGNRGDGDGDDGLYLYLLCCGDRGIAVAEERGVRAVGDEVVAAGKGIVDADSSLGNAQVVAVATAFRTVHAATLRTVAIVEQLGRQTSELRSLGSLEDEGRHGGTVLAKVDDERLAWFHRHHCSVLVLTQDNYFSVFLIGCTRHIFPYVGPDGT